MLDQTLEIFRGQGTLFWVGAASVATGLTLLVVTALTFLRQRLRGRAGTTADEPGPAAVPAASPGAAATLPAPPAAADLLERLRVAGDRLEALAARLDAAPARGFQSGLKEPARDVEYIFKQGIG